MDCKGRMNVEGDRLSMLPDDLIHKILSFMSIKHAIETSALSSKWRFMWTSLPYFNISTEDFRSLPDLCKFVNHVLSRRDSKKELYSVNLSFHQTVSVALLKEILEYAFSHNVQQLTITCSSRKKIDFPLHLFRSNSLKYLNLTGFKSSFREQYNIILTPTWELPSLTTLHLDRVAIYDDNDVGLFSKCANLKNLTLNTFTILKSHNFTLCHPQLSNLTLQHGCGAVSAVNVVAPLLVNLTIKSCYGKHLIDAPNLVSLLFHSSCLLHFSSDLHALEKVDLCIFSTYKWNGCEIAALLQQLHSVKLLTLNLEFVKTFISYMKQIPLQCSSLCNLEKLTIYPVYVPSDDEADEKLQMSTEVISFLLDGSPTATFTLISYEEVKEKEQKAQALAHARTAQSLMACMQRTLEEEKANIERNRTRTVRGKTTMESNEEDENDQGMTPVEKMKLHFKRKMKRMKKCCEDVAVQIDQGKRNTISIISQLHDIEVLLLKDLPASKRDELQASFSSLCAEVDIVVKSILHCINIPQVQLSDCFNELVTKSLRSS